MSRRTSHPQREGSHSTIRRRRMLVVGVLCLFALLPFFWWLCLPGHPGDLHHARSDHGAVLLPNGQVLVVGGSYRSASMIDPDGALAVWIQRTWPKFLWEKDLQFLWGTGGMLSSCELFDPQTRGWTMAVPLRQAGYGHPALLLPNGAVLEAEGELYEDGHWTETDPLAIGMCYMGLLPNGDVLGFPAEGGSRPWLYNSKSRTWTKDYGVQSGALATLGDDLVLIASEQHEGCCLYYPSKNYTRQTGDMLLPQQNLFSLIALADGRALAIGGENNASPCKGCEVFDLKTGTWKLTGDLKIARAYCEAVRLHDGRVLAMEGSNSPTDTSCELYDPITGLWTETGHMLTDRDSFTATVLQDGQVLVTGGNQERNERVVSLSSCELYDPKTGTWSRL